MKTPNYSLRLVRERKGWTQEQLAEQIEASAISVHRWECGAAFPNHYYRQKLCDLFGLDAEVLGLVPDVSATSSQLADEQYDPTIPGSPPDPLVKSSILPLVPPPPKKLISHRPMSSIHNQELLVHTTQAVRTITLNRPDRLNALNAALAEAIQAAIADASVDDAVRVIVLTGAGRGFCAGLDLSDSGAAALDGQDRHSRLDVLGWVGRQALTLTQCDKPIIAAINGAAAGAGLSLALAADIRLMAAGTRITTGYLRRGLVPDGGMAYFLPRLVGASRAAELILTARDIDAEEAERIGLVSRVLPAEGFQETTASYAADLASGPPIAQTLAKRLLAQSPDLDLRTMLQLELTSIKMCFTTDDVREGMRAFLEKRKPIFQGK